MHSYEHGMPEFNPTQGVEEDYYLDDFFPKSLPEHLHPFMEHRIILFLHGETQIVNTTCVIKRKMKSKIGKLSMHLVPYENLPLSFESCGYID